jgi:hypothetical protein
MWENVGTNLVVRQTSGGEDGNLLTARDAVHDIDGRNTRLDHLFGVDSSVGVDGGSCGGEHGACCQQGTTGGEREKHH